MDQAKSGLPFDISLLNGEGWRFSARWSCKFWRALTRWGTDEFFLKTSAPLSLINIYRMSIISAGSISLDSTFKITGSMWCWIGLSYFYYHAFSEDHSRKHKIGTDRFSKNHKNVGKFCLLQNFESQHFTTNLAFIFSPVLELKEKKLRTNIIFLYRRAALL